MSGKSFKYDIFLSHASEDKPIARKISESLKSKGLSVWFDEAEITIGDRISKSINQGLSQSEFGVVILSKAFINKESWNRKELGALFSREKSGRKIILPVVHGVSADELDEWMPILGDIHNANTEIGVEKVVDLIMYGVNKSRSNETSIRTSDSSSSSQFDPVHQRPIHVILAGCGNWARTRTVFPLYKEEPGLFEIVGISNLKKGQLELEEISSRLGLNYTCH